MKKTDSFKAKELKLLKGITDALEVIKVSKNEREYEKGVVRLLKHANSFIINRDNLTAPPIIDSKGRDIELLKAAGSVKAYNEGLIKVTRSIEKLIKDRKVKKSK